MMVRAAGFAGGRDEQGGRHQQGRAESVHTEQQQSPRGVEACLSGAVLMDLCML